MNVTRVVVVLFHLTPAMSFSSLAYYFDEDIVYWMKIIFIRKREIGIGTEML